MISCSKCGKLTAIDLLDAKDDGTGNFTVLECETCYGEGWVPAIQPDDEDDPGSGDEMSVSLEDRIQHMAFDAAEERAKANCLKAEVRALLTDAIDAMEVGALQVVTHRLKEIRRLLAETAG